MKKSKKVYFLAFLFALLAIGFLILSVGKIYKDANFQLSSITATGTVVSIEYQESGPGLIGAGHGDNSRPVDILTISFMTQDGRPVTFANDFGVASNVFKVNDKVVIVYDKNNPNVAHVSQPGNVTLWGFDIFYLLVSIFMFFGCWICLRLNSVQSVSKIGM